MATRKRAAPHVEEAEEGTIPSEMIERLDEMSAQELALLIEHASRIRETKLDSARQDFIDRTRAEAEQLGLAWEDLMPRQPAKREAGKRGPAAVKYRDKQGNEWTGRGRLPNWLAAHEAEGKSRDDFLIK